MLIPVIYKKWSSYMLTWDSFMLMWRLRYGGHDNNIMGLRKQMENTTGPTYFTELFFCFHIN